MRRLCVCGTLAAGLAALPAGGIADERKAPTLQASRHPFHPGEKLTYTLSWSKVFAAGTAVMEVKKEKDSAGRSLFRFVSTARTIGAVDKFYTVRDSVQSIVDSETMESIFYDLDQRHGSKKKKRKLTFDHVKRKVHSVSDGVESTNDMPEHTQDALSSLYYMRMVPEFTVGKPIAVGIFDSGKYWSVELHVLGRERIKTPVGEFDTVKVKTYPKYEGVFMHKGEIFMWITDDERRIPVLMKSTITIGSIVAQLTEMQLGEGGK